MPRVSKIRAEKATKKLRPLQQAMLNGNPKRIKQINEFVDKDHKVSMAFYDLTEGYQAVASSPDLVIKDMEKLIKEDPDFLDPYSYAAEAYCQLEDYDKYTSYTYRAYLKALHKVATKDGRYPKQLAWMWLENRHIIRALNNFALFNWDNGDIRLALEVYRKLLESNPADNIGARFSILALRMGYMPNYEDLFLPKIDPAYGLDAGRLSNWFEEGSKKYPEEFAEWLQAQEMI